MARTWTHAATRKTGWAYRDAPSADVHPVGLPTPQRSSMPWQLPGPILQRTPCARWTVCAAALHHLPGARRSHLHPEPPASYGQRDTAGPVGIQLSRERRPAYSMHQLRSTGMSLRVQGLRRACLLRLHQPPGVLPHVLRSEWGRPKHPRLWHPSRAESALTGSSWTATASSGRRSLVVHIEVRQPSAYLLDGRVRGCYDA